VKLSIITPEKTILDSVEVAEILVPGEKGEIGILPGHAPLVSTLGSGVLQYRLSQTKGFSKVAVSWGYCEVRPDKVVILAESADTKKALDAEQIKKSLKEIREKLKNVTLSPEEIRKLEQNKTEQETKLAIVKQ